VLFRSERIERVVDTEALDRADKERIERNAVGEVVLRTRRLLAVDEHRLSPATGRFVLVDDFMPVAGGQIAMDGYPDQRNLVTIRSTNITAVGHGVTAEARASRNGHKGAVFWFTGLSGAGKSTIALAAEAELFTRGYHVYVLDGDNIRTGLNSNLSFSPEDRAENIRRVGEVAALFADAGFIVISSFISPYRADRQRAREAAGERFHEIYIKASTPKRAKGRSRTSPAFSRRTKCPTPPTWSSTPRSCPSTTPSRDCSSMSRRVWSSGPTGTLGNRARRHAGPPARTVGGAPDVRRQDASVERAPPEQRPFRLPCTGSSTGGGRDRRPAGPARHARIGVGHARPPASFEPWRPT